MSGRAARALAVTLAGFGGLCFESAVLRGLGLVLGNTAASAALVVGAFVAALGLGGALAARMAGEPSGRSAARGYFATAIAIALVAWTLGRLPPLPPWPGLALALLLAGAPGLAMGYAFPRVFDGVSGSRVPALLVACNTLGSVLAAWATGNVLVPELGLRLCFALAALAYLLAAWLLRPAARTPPPAPSPAEPARSALPAAAVRLAAASGFVAIGYEVLLLRRLPFFLEGFQPTLSGILAGFLFALALGAALAAARPAGARGATWALVLAVLGAALGVHELVGAAVARQAVGSEIGYQFRILAAATLAAAPVAVPVGALVPLLLAAIPGARGRAAGALFCAQGFGSLGGALLVGQLLPLAAPRAFFVVTPFALALGVALLVPWRLALRGVLLLLVAASTALGLAGPGRPWSPEPPVTGSRYDRAGVYVPLAHASDAGTTASAVYDRSQHALVLFTDEFRAAWIGPTTSYMKVLGHLPFLLRDELQEVAIVALGTGTTADAVCAWPEARSIHVVEISPAVLSLADRFAGDGPVAGARRASFAVDPRVVVHVADGRRWLADRREGSLDLLTMEPLLPYAPGTAALYSREMYALAASRLRARGLCVQWVPTHAMPAASYRTLLATFADVFPHCSAWLVDHATLLVGSHEAHLPDAAALTRRFAAATPHARRTLHEAGLAAPHDVAIALVGTALRPSFAGVELLRDDRPFLERIGYWSAAVRLGFLGGNLAELARVAEAGLDAGAPAYLAAAPLPGVRRARLQAAIARSEAGWRPGAASPGEVAAAASAVFASAPGSVLLHQEALRARRFAIESELRAQGPAALADHARRFARLDPGSAAVQVASAGDRDDDASVAAAIARALAIDPTLPATWPEAFGRHLARVPADARGPLEDVSLLPEGEALVREASGDTPGAVALRAWYGVRVALALAEAARTRPLVDAELRALGEVADPASSSAYGDAVRARGGDLLAELGPVWRGDLAFPELLRGELDGAPARRAALAVLLAGRRSADAAEVLARLLVDGELTVRRAAAASLLRSFGDRVTYDPEGSADERERAADALRVLVRRRP